MRKALLISPILLVFVALDTEAQATLAIVEEVEWKPFCDHCRQLLQALEKTGNSLPARSVFHLKTLLEREPDDPGTAAVAVQKLLDAHCLIGVSINPESRVKAARGPAAVVLHHDRPAVVLIKVHNDGGVTHALRLHGPELIRAGEHGKERWLEAKLVTGTPFAPELTGRRVEYRLLRLTPRQSGKREATFQFDVGQGTQDLGFRAEVPILFTVREAD